jgi:hypothetical protein
MSVQLPLAVPRVSAQAARKQDDLSLFAWALAAAHRNVAAVRKAMFARRSTMSIRKDLAWDVGMDRLAEQASPPWVPRGW